MRVIAHFTSCILYTCQNSCLVICPGAQGSKAWQTMLKCILFGTAPVKSPDTLAQAPFWVISPFHTFFLPVAKTALAASWMGCHEQASLGGSTFGPSGDSCWLCPNSKTSVFHSSWINRCATVSSWLQTEGNAAATIPSYKLASVETLCR